MKRKKLAEATVKRLRLKKGDVLVVQAATPARTQKVAMNVSHLLAGVSVAVLGVPSDVGLTRLSIDDMPAEFLCDITDYVARKIAREEMLGKHAVSENIPGRTTINGEEVTFSMGDLEDVPCTCGAIFARKETDILNGVFGSGVVHVFDGKPCYHLATSMGPLPAGVFDQEARAAFDAEKEGGGGDE